MKIGIALEKAVTFAELERLAEKVEPQVSALGCERIISSEHEGSLPIDSLIQRVKAVKALNVDFDEVERGHARALVGRMNVIYAKSDEQFNHCHPIIHWLALLKILFGFYNERNMWEWYDRCFQARYSKNQFEAVFGYPPPSDEGLTLDQLSKRGVKRERFLHRDAVEWFVSSEYKARNALPENPFRRNLFLYFRNLLVD